MVEAVSIVNQDYFALVDDDDYDLVLNYRWYLKTDGIGKYAQTKINGKWVTMHKLITGDKNLDHKNHNGLDNRRSNLRRATQSSNMANARLKPGKSGYRGVQPHKGKFKVVVTKDYVKHYLGLFQSIEEAAKAYNNKVTELFGEFAILNEIEGI